MRLTRLHTLGIAGTGLAVVAYALGTVVPYPGRELSLALGMVSITVLAIGGIKGEPS